MNTTFNFRLDTATREKLDRLAKKFRRTRGDTIRFLIEEGDSRDEEK